MNPLATSDWLILTTVACLVGLIRAMRPLASRRQVERRMIRITEAVTAIFTTVACFVALWFAFVPFLLAALGLTLMLEPVGLIAVSAILAHLGITKAILAVRGVSQPH